MMKIRTKLQGLVRSNDYLILTPISYEQSHKKAWASLQKEILAKFARKHLMMDILLNRKYNFNSRSQIGFKVANVLCLDKTIEEKFHKLNDSQKEAVEKACF